MRALDPNAKVVASPSDSLVVVSTPGHNYELLPVWAGEGYPQDVRHAIQRLGLSAMQERNPVVTAGNMSPGARDHLDRLGLAWADESGAARIVVAPALAVLRASSAPVHRVRPLGGFQWSPSAGAVAELLLTRRAGEPRAKSVPPLRVLSDQLGWSVAQVSKVMRGFDDSGWTVKSGTTGLTASRRLLDPSGMLSSWASWQAKRDLPAVKSHAHWKDPRTFVHDRLATAMPRESWCVTGWLALQELAPHVTTIPSISCYVEATVFDSDLPRVLDRAGLRPVEAGERVTLRRAEPHVLTLASNTWPRTAPAVRVYADLLTAGVRGEDAAEHLRETVLGY